MKPRMPSIGCRQRKTYLMHSIRTIDKVKLLDYFILGNPKIEDVYFIMLKARTKRKQLNVAVMRANDGSSQQHLEPVWFYSKARGLASVQMKLPTRSAMNILGRSLEKKTCMELGVDMIYGLVEGVWNFASCCDKKALKDALAKAFFSKKNRKDSYLTLVANKDLEIVPRGTLAELNILADIDPRSNGEESNGQRT